MNQRRVSQRIPMELPVEIKWIGRTGKPRQAKGITGNISGSGLFIEIPVRPNRATQVTIKVALPNSVTHVPLELLCKGRVVRWNKHGKTQGLAAIIDEYELRPLPRTEPGAGVPPKATV